MIALIFISLAAFFNSVMDSVENEHIHDTIFSKLNPSFWYKRESWDKAKKIFGYKFDAWHLSKSAMIVCFITGFYFAYGFEWYYFPIGGVVWNAVFNLFYSVVWKRKK